MALEYVKEFWRPEETYAYTDPSEKSPVKTHEKNSHIVKRAVNLLSVRLL